MPMLERDRVELGALTRRGTGGKVGFQRLARVDPEPSAKPRRRFARRLLGVQGEAAEVSRAVLEGDNCIDGCLKIT